MSKSKLNELFELRIEESIRALGDDYESFDTTKFSQEFVDEYAAKLRASLDQNTSGLVDWHRSAKAEFEEYCESIWGEAFCLLESLIELCCDLSLTVQQDLPASSKAEFEFNQLLFKFHGRACHISKEILSLLRSGFADSAHARWRALHEVNATSMFIEKHGHECAERFILHDVIDSYDQLKETLKYKDRLQVEMIPEEEIQHHKELYNDAIQRMGKGFDTHYGWAAYIYPERSPRSVGFGTIEKDVGLDHMRPYYKWASQNVHSGSKGTNKRLGLKQSDQDKILVGRSVYGFTDPAHCTAISLMQSTLVILRLSPSVDSLINSKVLLKYSNDIGATFLKISKELESDEESHWG